MTVIQMELTRLDAQLTEAAALMNGGVDAEMAEADAAVRALAQDIADRRRAALAAVNEAAERRLGATVPSQGSQSAG